MNIFTYGDYRDFINDALEEQIGRGAKVKLAEVLNCGPGYISQVLNKSKIHFSPENIIKVASFLKLKSQEEDFLFTLLHAERAGSKELQDFYRKKIKTTVVSRRFRPTNFPAIMSYRIFHLVF